MAFRAVDLLFLFLYIFFYKDHSRFASHTHAMYRSIRSRIVSSCGTITTSGTLCSWLLTAKYKIPQRSTAAAIMHKMHFNSILIRLMDVDGWLRKASLALAINS